MEKHVKERKVPQHPDTTDQAQQAKYEFFDYIIQFKLIVYFVTTQTRLSCSGISCG